MRRKFITNLVLLVFLNLIIKPFWVLGIDMGVQNEVGPVEYGFYYTILNFAFIFQVILDLGITNFNNRNIARNNQLITKYFSSIVVLRFIFAIAYFLVIMLVAYLLNYSNRQFYLLAIIGFNQFLLSFILYLRSNFSALLLFKTDSIISVLDRLILIVVCGILLWGNVTSQEFQIEWFVYAQTASYLATAIIALSLLLPKMNFKKLNWDPVFFIHIIKKSFPFALLVFLMSIYGKIDSVLLERILPESGNLQVGIYASAFRLLDVANNMSGLLFAGLLLPIFSKLIKEKKDLSKMVKLGFTPLFLLSTSVAIIAYFYGSDIMQVLYHQHGTETAMSYGLRMEQTAAVFQVLMMVFIATSTTYIFGTLLTANGSLKALNLVAFIGVLISLSLNFILIPNFEALGSAYASFSAQGITAIMQLYLAFKLLKINFEPSFIFRMLLFVILASLSAYLSSFIDYNWLVQLALSTILILLISIGLQLLHFGAVLHILRNEE
ncbi:MAG: oligosaccharide flippase family protein [Bacteroidales bacterium]|nr:oligosaccharide flippase family protein [Bacteroidales bacterium]